MANATIRVQFGDPAAALSANAHLSAEIDTRPDGLNGGRSSFSAGEDVYLLVYKSSNVTISQAVASAGSVSSVGSTVVNVEEDVMFEDSETSNIMRPATRGITDTLWLGRSLGALTLQSDKTTVKAAQKGIAVARVTYKTDALVYKLTSPAQLAGLTDFLILVVIQGDVSV